MANLYLPFADFIIKFPMSTKLFDNGGQGQLFTSRDLFLVKKFHVICDFANELNYSSQLNHPCILRPLNWSFDGRNGYIAMYKGEKLKEAYSANQISMKEIICDLLSALQYLHNLNICHNDIKLRNMIFFKKRAMLIDLGCASNENYYDNDIEHIRYCFDQLFALDDNSRKISSYLKRLKNIDTDALKSQCGFILFDKSIKFPNRSFSCINKSDQKQDLMERCLEKVQTENIDLLQYIVKKLVHNAEDLPLIDASAPKNVIVTDCLEFVIDILLITDCKLY